MFVDGSVVLQFNAYNGAGATLASKEIFFLKKGVPSTGIMTASDAAAMNADASTGTSTKAVAPVNISKVQIQQGGTAFEVNDMQSGYVLERGADLTVTATVAGAFPSDAIISAVIKNQHASSSSEIVYQGIEKNGSTGVSVLSIPHSNLPPGIYEIEIAPIDVKKNQIGPSRKVVVGIEGIAAVIQAFSL